MPCDGRGDKHRSYRKFIKLEWMTLSEIQDVFRVLRGMPDASGATLRSVSSLRQHVAFADARLALGGATTRRMRWRTKPSNNEPDPRVSVGIHSELVS